jgi:TIR domain
MGALNDLPEIVGFFSYSREDDEAFRGALSGLRDAISRELSAQLGRTKRSFRLWQDQEAIAPGTLWESEIRAAVAQSSFFIPIVTPRAVNSPFCHFEFTSFLDREREFGRSDLIFPILYIGVPALEDRSLWRDNPALPIIAARQYVDWRPIRQHDLNTIVVREAVERFSGKIAEALGKPWESPEERRERELLERAKQRLRAEEAEVHRQNALAEQRRTADQAAKRPIADGETEPARKSETVVLALASLGAEVKESASGASDHVLETPWLSLGLSELKENLQNAFLATIVRMIGCVILSYLFIYLIFLVKRGLTGAYSDVSDLFILDSSSSDIRAVDLSIVIGSVISSVICVRDWKTLYLWLTILALVLLFVIVYLALTTGVSVVILTASALLMASASANVLLYLFTTLRRQRRP